VCVVCDVIDVGGGGSLTLFILLLLFTLSFVHFTVSCERTVCTILMVIHVMSCKEEDRRYGYGRLNIYIFLFHPTISYTRNGFLRFRLFYLYTWSMPVSMPI